MKKWILAYFIFCSLAVSALHIVGGELSYEHLGADSYEVTLIVYRDCNSSGGLLDNPAMVAAYDGNGVFYDIWAFIDPQISLISTQVAFDCQNITAQVCVQRGFYQRVIDLPPNSSGYTIVYQRCCRNSSIININTPDNWGSTYTTFVPAVDVYGINSSAVFSSLPPVGLCKDYPFEYDHSATDSDGDSLAYKFCTPYHGGSQGTPVPNPPSAPPFTNIQWALGYNVNYQIAASPAFSLDPVTGILSGTPSQQGQFVLGICVEEYRDGVLINEVRRDFQFNVVLCPNLVISSFADLNNGLFCQGLGVQLDNQSLNASTYFWDFGDGGFSTEENPFHLYGASGAYSVTLISDPGASCPDTIVAIYEISQSPLPEILDGILNCPEGSFDFNVSGPLFDPENYTWTIPAGASSNGLNSATLDQVFFPEPGFYDISIEVINTDGCTGTDEFQVEVPEQPIANIQVTDDPCLGLVIDFGNGSQNASSFLWDFGDNSSSSSNTAAAPVHTYPSSGSYNVTLTAISPGSCPNTDNQQIQVFPLLFVELEPIAPQCTTGNEFDFTSIGNVSASSVYIWSVMDASGTELSASPNNVQFLSSGSYLVTVSVIDGPCMFSDQGFAIVVDPVQADFFSDDGGCVPETAELQDLTTGGMGLVYLWEFGDGTAADFPGSLSHKYEQAGSYDVRLEVEATAGCPSSDVMIKTNYIEVLPTPQASFLADPPFADINAPLVSFNSASTGATECEFIIEGLGTILDCELAYIFPGGGSYEVTLAVSNEYGCTDQISRPYIVRGHSFYAPNAITLNQDGLNDFFLPVVTGELAEYELIIFDRWGQTQFRTTSIEKPWVPDYSQIGEHAYHARVRDAYNVPVIYEGTFSVLR